MRIYKRSEDVDTFFDRTNKNGLAVSGLVISLSSVSLYKVIESQCYVSKGFFFGAIVAALVQQLFNYLSDDHYARAEELRECMVLTESLTEESYRSIMGDGVTRLPGPLNHYVDAAKVASKKTFTPIAETHYKNFNLLNLWSRQACVASVVLFVLGGIALFLDC